MRDTYDCGRLWFDPFIIPSTEKLLRVCRYTTFCERHGLEYGEFMQTVPSPDGFTLRDEKRYIIVYNDAPHIPVARKRFTLAHELGHYALRHQEDGDRQEQEADCFARNLLAPRLVAIKHDIDFPDYPKVFGISAAAARMCERMRDDDERLAAGLYPTK